MSDGKHATWGARFVAAVRELFATEELEEEPRRAAQRGGWLSWVFSTEKLEDDPLRAERSSWLSWVFSTEKLEDLPPAPPRAQAWLAWVLSSEDLDPSPLPKQERSRDPEQGARR